MGNKIYKFGESDNYKKGDIVVWRGRNPCIGKIKKRANHTIDYLIGSCWVIDEQHNSLHFSNLRYATHEEIKKLGDKQKLLIIDQK